MEMTLFAGPDVRPDGYGCRRETGTRKYVVSVDVDDVDSANFPKVPLSKPMLPSLFN